MASRVGIGQAKWTALLARLRALGVHDDDLRQRFVRASGAGGQHVNTSATAVWLLHVPSGTEVKAQSSRSQAMNRYQALCRLADKLEAARDGAASKQEQEAEKIRRQKRRRSRRSKAKSVADKRRVGDKKQQRRRPDSGADG